MKNKNDVRKMQSVLLAAGVLLALSGCSGKKDDKVSEIQNAGVFHVAIVNTDSAYTYFEGETALGLEPDIAEAIAQALGVPAQYQVMNRREALNAVAEGWADIAVGCIDASESVRSDYSTSATYGKGVLYAVTKKDDFVMSVGALENSLVGAASLLNDAARLKISQTGAAVQDYTETQTAADDIRSGRIRAYICYEAQAEALAEDSELQVQNIMNLDAEEYAVISSKDSKTLASGINTIVCQFLEKE